MRHIRRATLVPFPQCPQCKKPFHEYLPRSGDGFPQCQGKHHGRRCGARWWFMMLVPGLIEPQLADAFGAELAPILMAEHPELPVALAEPMAWQLAVTPHEAHIHRHSPIRVLAQALGLLGVRAAS